MNDKDLSKPVGYACHAELHYATLVGGGPFTLYATPGVTGYDIPTYSPEYVQSLLGKIAELQAWRDEYQGKLNAEHVRVGRQYMETLEAQKLRIVELETIVNTPIQLPFIRPVDGELPIAGMCNRARNEVRNAIKHILIGHGLTVQGDDGE